MSPDVGERCPPEDSEPDMFGSRKSEKSGKQARSEKAELPLAAAKDEARDRKGDEARKEDEDSAAVTAAVTASTTIVS
ncbi:hypothetical protein AB0399_07420 [Streptomyces sp. NPDC088194]|uniref:hypothetical protein n=1 Tax=Streptomyces sp. NPDC088194 TaxID=3154931 RepID=UPI00344CFE99